jgi:hypothetical protein
MQDIVFSICRKVGDFDFLGLKAPDEHVGFHEGTMGISMKPTRREATG